MFGLAWGVGYQILLAYQEDLKLSSVKIYILLLAMFSTTWLGAKIFFLFTLPEKFRSELLPEVSFWLGGGLVFLGGLIFGLITFFIWKKITGFSFKYSFPMLLALVWGHAIGRLGCLLAGCCYGSKSSLPWAIHLHGVDRHPTQAYEMVLLIFTALFLVRVFKKTQDMLQTLSWYFILYGGGRFVIEFFRGDEIRGQWGPFSPSQWVGLALFIGGIILFYLPKAKFSSANISKSQS